MMQRLRAFSPLMAAFLFVSGAASAQVSNVIIVDPTPNEEVALDPPTRIPVVAPDGGQSLPTALALLDLDASTGASDPYLDVLVAGRNFLYRVRNEPTPGFLGLSSPEVALDLGGAGGRGPAPITVAVLPIDAETGDLSGGGDALLIVAFHQVLPVASRFVAAYLAQGDEITEVLTHGGVLQGTPPVAALAAGDFDDNGVDDLAIAYADGSPLEFLFFCPSAGELAVDLCA